MFPQHISYREICKIIKNNSTTYTWIARYLFKFRLDHILRSCIREGEVHDILHGLNYEPCGGNYAAESKTYKILQVSYYWLALHNRDNFRNGNLSQNEETLVNLTSPQYAKYKMFGDILEKYSIF
jgi:hypothetical protein